MLHIESFENRLLLTAEMLMDFNSTPIGVDPLGFVEYQDEVYFWTPGKELRNVEFWKTNGSKAGTKLLSAPNGELIVWMEEVNDQLMAVVGTSTDNEHQYGAFTLYRLEGESFQLVQVLAADPYLPYVRSMVKGTDGLGYFTGGLGGPGGESVLWSTDGEQVQLEHVSQWDLNWSTPAGDNVFFVRPINNSGNNLNQELWSFNTNTREASVVRDIWAGAEGSHPRDLLGVNGSLYFTAEDESHGRELWVSDGTGDNTRLVDDVFAGIGSSNPSHLIALDNDLLFLADDGVNGRQLWMVDGETQATRRVTNAASPPAHVNKVSDALVYLTHSDDETEVWKVADGDAQLVASLPASQVDVSYIEANSSFILYADNGDGISAWLYLPTHNLHELGTFEGASQALTLPSLAGRPIFAIDNSIYAYDQETDSAALRGEVPPGALKNSIQIGESLLYPASLENGIMLGKTDGASFEVILDAPFETLSTYTRIIETSSGPLMIVERGLGTPPGSFENPFTAQLYTTDGSPDGTQLLSTEPRWMPQYNNQFGDSHYIVVDDTVYFVDQGTRELTKADLTQQGTTVASAEELNRDSPESQFENGWLQTTSPVPYLGVPQQTNHGTYKLENNRILRQSDRGFTRVVDLQQLGLEVVLSWWDAIPLLAVGDILYFTASSSEFGTELWQSDGTLEGTKLVEDVMPGPEGSGARLLGRSNETLLFEANDGVHGREVWAYTPLNADLDGSGTVDFSDFLILAANFGSTTDKKENGDINGDGHVGFADFLLLSAQFDGDSESQRIG